MFLYDVSFRKLVISFKIIIIRNFLLKRIFPLKKLAFATNKFYDDFSDTNSPPLASLYQALDE